MSKIVCHGSMAIPETIRANATTIRFQNYKTNTPKQFRVCSFDEEEDIEFLTRLSRSLGINREKLDFVYFSVCKGAEPHVDQLDPHIFKAKTFVIPVILPRGNSVITAEDETAVVKLDHIYEFNHERLHSMTLEDTESGCVVIMVAEKF